jgi:hypothetical protein
MLGDIDINSQEMCEVASNSWSTYAERMAHNFPIARKLLAFAAQARRNWLTRHRNAFNFWIHMLGIPLAMAGLLALFLLPWQYGLGMIVLGYFLQWLGHQFEGNDVGELIPIKRLLGFPVVAIAPQYQERKEFAANQPLENPELK